MRILIFFASIILAIQTANAFSAEPEDGQKVCHIKGKFFDDLADDGVWAKGLGNCAKGDVIAFDQEGTRLNDMIVAIARVCDTSTVSMVNRNIPTAAVCIYTGRILPVISD